MELRKRQVLTLALVAIVPRLLWFGITYVWYRVPWSLYLAHSDGESYAKIVDLLLGGTRPAFSWHERVFWGWPLTLIPFQFLSWDIALLFAGLLFSVGATLFFFLLVKNFKLSLVFALIPPAWLFHSCLGMSEPALLFASLLSLWLLQQEKYSFSGLALAYAYLIRPTAIFIVPGVLLVLYRRKDWRALVVWLLCVSLGAWVEVGLNLHFYGKWNQQMVLHSAPPNIRATDLKAIGSDFFGNRTQFNLPLKALIETPFKLTVPLWKVIYVWGLGLVLIGANLNLWRRRRESSLATIMATWAGITTLFIFSAGPYWGFHSFDRYALWALPAYLYAFRDLPLPTLQIGLTGAVSWLAAVWAALK